MFPKKRSRQRKLSLQQLKKKLNLWQTNYKIRRHLMVLMGSEGGQTDPNVDIPRLLNLYAKDKLTLDDLITHRFPLT